MHELAVTQSIINISSEEAVKHNVKTVKEIRIHVGELSGLIPECIQYYFNIASKDTIVEGALLKIKKMPIKIKCNECGHINVIKKGEYSCPKCNSYNIKIIGGNEFFIESLEVE
ncbi:hydrogenase maturation nickel metallochaperone HypA [Haloimpatiens sp. FM7330]|uniref:hydrogenase maturation nickel metallochaperone HypA n=1 Tax=Haloimpatiens sp. FM7330 TaxID=3298610 RepID=UPI00362EEDF0